MGIWKGQSPFISAESNLQQPADLQFEIKGTDEDIHTANERRVSEIVGAVGGKLHTGRSRNDQCATDLRLWLLDEIKDIESALKGLVRVMVERADKEKDILMPGYTHLQVGRTKITQRISPS
jgi:argininosuccinate lyase